MVPLQEQSIQEIINQQLLLQEQLRPLADGGVDLGEKRGQEPWGDYGRLKLSQWRFRQVNLSSSKQP